MKLTWEEIKSIANRLDEIIGDNFHDAMWNTISERDVDYDFEVSDEVIEQIKEQLIEYSNESSVHSNYEITFNDLLLNIWQRIQNHKDSTEIKKVLNQEMKDGLCKCYTGRMSRLVNSLNGFCTDVEVNISSNEQIE